MPFSNAMRHYHHPGREKIRKPPTTFHWWTKMANPGLIPGNVVASTVQCGAAFSIGGDHKVEVSHTVLASRLLKTRLDVSVLPGRSWGRRGKVGEPEGFDARPGLADWPGPPSAGRLYERARHGGVHGRPSRTLDGQRVPSSGCGGGRTATPIKDSADGREAARGAGRVDGFCDHQRPHQTTRRTRRANRPYGARRSEQQELWT